MMIKVVKIPSVVANVVATGELLYHFYITLNDGKDRIRLQAQDNWVGGTRRLYICLRLGNLELRYEPFYDYEQAT